MIESDFKVALVCSCGTQVGKTQHFGVGEGCGEDVKNVTYVP